MLRVMVLLVEMDSGEPTPRRWFPLEVAVEVEVERVSQRLLELPSYKNDTINKAESVIFHREEKYEVRRNSTYPILKSNSRTAILIDTVQNREGR